MKNISLYLNIILIVAVTLLYIDRFSEKGNDKKNSAIVDTNNVQKADIVYINIDSLLNGYDYYNDLSTTLMKKQEKLEGNLNSKNKSLQRKAMEFQQKVDKHLVTSSQAQQMQQQLMQEQQNLLKLKDQMSRQLMGEQQKMNKKIYDRVKAYLKKYNEKENHNFILSNTMVSTVLLADSTLNITQKIMDGLNEDYRAENKEEKETDAK